MTRKPHSKYSKHAQRVQELIPKVITDVFISDPSWAEAEAAGLETPIGRIHLHWMSHRGRGHWNLVSKGSSVCNTVRCRIVTIIPEGGEHEAARLNQYFLQVQEEWYARKNYEYEAELRITQLVEEIYYR